MTPSTSATSACRRHPTKQSSSGPGPTADPDLRRHRLRRPPVPVQGQHPVSDPHPPAGRTPRRAAGSDHPRQPRPGNRGPRGRSDGRHPRGHAPSPAPSHAWLRIHKQPGNTDEQLVSSGRRPADRRGASGRRPSRSIGNRCESRTTTASSPQALPTSHGTPADSVRVSFSCSQRDGARRSPSSAASPECLFR